MDEQHLLAERFEADRGHLHRVAYRLLGSAAEADDAVQDAWLRASRASRDQTDVREVANLTGWFTTIVARVCLNVLQSRRARREQPLDDAVPDPLDDIDPLHDVVVADSVGVALLVVLGTLTPAERLAFVLHDLFAVPFEEVAAVVGKSPATARQLASRARRRLRGSGTDAVDLARQRVVVEAFLKASRSGDFAALLEVLDPDVVLHADPVAVSAAAQGLSQGAPALLAQLHGAAAVARTFSGRAGAAQPALIDGRIGLVWAPDGNPRAVFDLTVLDGRIAAIEVWSDPAVVRSLAIDLL